jgi:hypothetical protein
VAYKSITTIYRNQYIKTGNYSYYSGVETIIRGEEIHIQGDIVLRDVEPSNTDDENSGG